MISFDRPDMICRVGLAEPEPEAETVEMAGAEPTAAGEHSQQLQTWVRRRVLIVDDDALVRASLGCVLECEGFAVLGAAGGHAAVQCVMEHSPDLVLLDLNMPDMNGWTAYARMEQARPLMPVVVITARPHQFRLASDLGVDAFMEKPLNIPVLVQAVRALTSEPADRRARRIAGQSFATCHLDVNLPEFWLEPHAPNPSKHAFQ